MRLFLFFLAPFFLCLLAATLPAQKILISQIQVVDVEHLSAPDIKRVFFIAKE